MLHLQAIEKKITFINAGRALLKNLVFIVFQFILVPIISNTLKVTRQSLELRVSILNGFKKRHIGSPNWLNLVYCIHINT